MLIFAEHTVDYFAGLTDEQLDLHLDCAFGSSERMFAACSKAFPEYVVAPEE